jgi:alpha-beta hydrolase superfamily lysophospholipase
LIPGTNGSGALLAYELSQRGFITVRYDKRASGLHMAENVQKMAGKISLPGHAAELSGGVQLLASHPDVNPAKIFVLTNSEGCVHALYYQNQKDILPFAGMVLTSAFARKAGDLAHSQIAAQLAAVPGGDVILSKYDSAIADFLADCPITIDETLPVGLQQVVMAITQPVNQPFSRELWIFDPVAELSKIKVPVLIAIGKKDIQVDWLADGSLFEKVAKEHKNITISYFDYANHVLKFEAKPREQLTPTEVMVSYGSADVMLDPETVNALTTWLQSHL